MRALVATCVITAGLTVVAPAHADGVGDGTHAVTYPVVVDGFGSHTSRTLDPVRISEHGVTAVAPRRLAPQISGQTSGQTSQERVARGTTAPTPIAQHVYVAVATDSGTIANTDAQLTTMIDNGLAWWKTQAGSAITSFSAAAVKRFSSGLSTASSRCGLGSDPEKLWDKAWDQFPDVDFNAAGNHLVVVVAESCATDGASGLGTVGDTLSSGGLVTVPDETDIFPSVITHELGHNFGLEHANLDCDGCEYLNLYSIMGLAVETGDTPFAAPALDSAYRAQLGITGPDEIATLPAGATTTVTLFPRSSATGIRGVALTAGYTTYWLDFRSGTGSDAGTFYAEYPNSPLDPTNLPETYPVGVTVEAQQTDPVSYPGGYDYRATTLMDENGRGALTAGQSFTDDALTVTVNAISPDDSSAQVTVTTSKQFSMPDPTITGALKVGSTLTAHAGTWSPSPTHLFYQWFANGAAISGVRKDVPTFALTKAQQGKHIAVSVFGERTGYLTDGRVSDPTGVVRAGTLATSRPKITGTAKVGRKLTAKHGHWTAGTSFHYRWYANGHAIAHATHGTLKLTHKVKGKRITVRVTGTKPGYVTASRISAKTHKVKR